MLDEKNIEQRLNDIAQMELSEDASARAVESTRQMLLRNPPSPRPSFRLLSAWVIGSAIAASLAALLLWLSFPSAPNDEPSLVEQGASPGTYQDPLPPGGGSDSQVQLVSTTHGAVRGRFVFDGNVPEMTFAAVTEDAQFCAPVGLKDESLLVNERNRGVANVVIMLYLEQDEKAPLPPPSFACATAVEMTNELCRFEPRICVVNTQQKLVLANGDRIGHNMRVDFFSNPPVNPTIAGLDKQEYIIGSGERLPVRVSCGLHPWMNGWVVVKNHPYVAVTDRDGYFELPAAPAGKWKFQAWHEVCGYVSEVKQGDQEQMEWERGLFEVEVPKGEAVDLGKFAIASTLFDR